MVFMTRCNTWIQSRRGSWLWLINKTSVKQELSELIDSCSASKLNVIIDVLKSTKTSLDKYYD